MTELTILDELKTLLPPLSDEEYAGLETNLIQDGCLSDLIAWGNILVDGHNRYEICRKHQIPFGFKNIHFETLDDAKLWIWKQQEGRRNLTPYQRTQIALKFKPILVAKGKEKMSDGGRNKGRENSTDLPKENQTRDEIAKFAKVSNNTVSRVEYIEEHADEETKENLRQGKTTINKEYNRLKEGKKATASKPKKSKTPKTNEESSVSEPETPQASSKNMTCAEELGPYVSVTTLKNIRQDHPDYLLRALASHFRKGFIEDLMEAGMAFLHEKHGEKVTTPIAKRIANRYIKTKR